MIRVFKEKIRWLEEKVYMHHPVLHFVMQVYKVVICFHYFRDNQLHQEPAATSAEWGPDLGECRSETGSWS